MMEKKIVTSISNLQLARHLFKSDIDAPDDVQRKALIANVRWTANGEPNSSFFDGDTIVINQPTSLAHFLYNSILHAATIKNPLQKDKFSIALLQRCKEYVFNDFDRTEKDISPTLLSYNKISIPSIITDEIIEPLVGNTLKPSVLYIPSNTLDCADIANSINDVKKYTDVKLNMHPSMFPCIIANSSIYNKAAVACHIFVKNLHLTFGELKSSRILKKLLLNNEGDITKHLFIILKTLNGEPDYIVRFFDYLESHLSFTQQEKNESLNIKHDCIMSDNYLKSHIKIAYSVPNPQAWKQWSQWSMLVGLIEKQLEPMRGSMWPASENLKPTENLKKKMISDKARSKGKTQLNYEELLEVARDMYNHKAIQPGRLYEELLRDHRVWKV